MIYTSYFAKIKIIANPISICGKAPDWYTGFQYKKLAPKYDFFMEYKEGIKNSKSDHDRKLCEDIYTENFYSQVLSHLDASSVVMELIDFYNSDNVTLLCYEKPTDFCHRHIVASWLNDNGFECKELTV